MEHLVEPVQINIRQQGRDDSSLRRAFCASAHLRRSAIALLLHNRRFQPHPDQLDHRSVSNTLAYTSQQLPMWNRIEVPFQIGNRRPPDSPPADARESLPGHHAPILRFGIHSYNPENPLRRSAPRSGTSPSGQRDPLCSGFPVAAASHSLSQSRPAVLVSADTFSASAIARSHPEIVELHPRFARSSSSRRRPRRARPRWPSPVSMPFPIRRADRFGHTAHKTETSALALPSR